MEKEYWIEHPKRLGKHWLIRYSIGDGVKRMTQGTSEYNAFEMAADAIATSLGIRASWYRRFIFKIFKV